MTCAILMAGATLTDCANLIARAISAGASRMAVVTQTHRAIRAARTPEAARAAIRPATVLPAREGKAATRTARGIPMVPRATVGTLPGAPPTAGAMRVTGSRVSAAG